MRQEKRKRSSHTTTNSVVNRPGGVSYGTIQGSICAEGYEQYQATVLLDQQSRDMSPAPLPGKYGRFDAAVRGKQHAVGGVVERLWAERGNESGGAEWFGGGNCLRPSRLTCKLLYARLRWASLRCVCESWPCSLF